ncbi:MAG: hypothetical protein K9N05_08755, partial [Candidatus Marinimicrobia bacterium]|nr:hypothetical protein [Candidatus Neomarinimicrobiota bacterium]
MKLLHKYIISLVLIIGTVLFALDPNVTISSGNEKEMYFRKQQELQKPTIIDADRPVPREAIISGNQIRTLVFDYGSIGHPSREPSMEWPIYSAHGYAYEFGPLVGVEVPVDANGHYIEAYTGPDGMKELDRSVPGYDTTYYIVSDGLLSGGGVLMNEVSPTNKRWGWEPLADYANDESESIPMSHKPDTWNPAWGNNWPGTYKAGVSSADQSIYYEMDDRYNLEFYPAFKPFSPYDSIAWDSLKLSYGGTGISIVVRAYQWSNPEASDAVFFVYEVTNESENDYEKVVFGMFGDPHIGGSNDYSDDMAYFDNQLNMVYGYDSDNRGDWNGVTGWLGYTFLESPGNPYDGIDNDGDGMVDESMQDGIDNDGDWDVDRDDVGQDGLGPLDPGYPGPDFGEGDGIPTSGDPDDPTKPGEPHFDGTDLDEADQIGLTSFDAF